MTPEQFESEWSTLLARDAQVLIKWGTPDPTVLIHTSIADAFVGSLGLKPIGFNWELLDASAPASERRSARGEITAALAHDLENPSRPWLAPQVAKDCAEQFLSLFDPSNLTVVSNRHDGLWHPIAGHAVEWGFVGFDATRIALLLLAPK